MKPDFKASNWSHSLTRKPQVSASEIITILIFYLWSGFKNFHRWAADKTIKTRINHVQINEKNN